MARVSIPGHPGKPNGPLAVSGGTDGARTGRTDGRVRACETPTVVRRRPRRHRRPPGYDRRMRSLPTVLLILSLPAGAIAYVVATRILSSLDLPNGLSGFPDPDRATLRRGPRDGAIPHPVLRPQGEGGPRRAPASRGVGRGEWRRCLGRRDARLRRCCPRGRPHRPSDPDDPTAAAVKAAIRERYGPPEVVEVREVDTPTPKDDEVLVRVRAASVNRADLDYLGPRPGFIRPFDRHARSAGPANGDRCRRRRRVRRRRA